jgi:hypothetical protein
MIDTRIAKNAANSFADDCWLQKRMQGLLLPNTSRELRILVTHTPSHVEQRGVQFQWLVRAMRTLLLDYEK